jgi:hypothetical protein
MSDINDQNNSAPMSEVERQTFLKKTWGDVLPDIIVNYKDVVNPENDVPIVEGQQFLAE